MSDGKSICGAEPLCHQTGSGLRAKNGADLQALAFCITWLRTGQQGLNWEGGAGDGPLLSCLSLPGETDSDAGSTQTLQGQCNLFQVVYFS